MLPSAGIQYNGSWFASVTELEELFSTASSQILDLQIFVAVVCPIQLFVHPVPRKTICYITHTCMHDENHT